MHDRTLRSTSVRPGSSSLASHLRPDPSLPVCLVLELILFAPLTADRSQVAGADRTPVIPRAQPTLCQVGNLAKP